MKNKHWLIIIAMSLLWCAVFFFQLCKQPPYYLEVSLATATVLIIIWSSTLNTGDISTKKQYVVRLLLTIFGSFLSLLLISAFLILVVSFFIPSYTCINNRVRVSQVLQMLNETKNQISQNTINNKTTSKSGEGVQTNLDSQNAEVLVSSNGVMTVLMRNPTALLILTPSLDNSNGVAWKCQGFPMKDMPANCRELPFQ